MSTSKKSAKAKAKARFHDLKPTANPKGGGTLPVTGIKALNNAAKITLGPTSSPSNSDGTVGSVVSGWDITTNKSA
jgi:hypothetical protein